MNLLFLDFDGVINNPATEHRPYVWPDWHQNAGLVSNTRWIEPNLIAIVERIRAAFDADIVISSTWRQHYTLEQLRDILECHIPRSRVIDVTPKLYSDRGTEIEYSLRKYAPDKYLILDDYTPSSFLVHQQPYLVQTDDDLGITNSDADRAIRLINPPAPETL